MDEQAIRALVREAVNRHLGGAGSASAEPRPMTFLGHASHGRYPLPGSGAACLIEPAVQCTHCGYCQSHGH